VREDCQENSLKQGHRFRVALPDSGLTLAVGPAKHVSVGWLPVQHQPPYVTATLVQDPFLAHS
uniref:Uncharacterized protein n=2 Tax=Bos TaxID=9903 RepID=A0A4W2DYR1_BOBOX